MTTIPEFWFDDQLQKSMQINLKRWHCAFHSVNAVLLPILYLLSLFVVVGAEFMAFMEAFKPYLVEALRDRAEYQVTTFFTEFMFIMYIMFIIHIIS